MEDTPEWDDADNQLQDPEELKVLFTALDSYVSVVFCSCPIPTPPPRPRITAGAYLPADCFIPARGSALPPFTTYQPSHQSQSR